MRDGLQSASAEVLTTADPAEKADTARRVAEAWRAGQLSPPDDGAPSCAPAAPARPTRPELVPPGQAPRRRLGSKEGRLALLHAVAHIEFNAIDLAFDLVARFGGDRRIAPEHRRAFLDDWIGVGDDEARHFKMVQDRLAELGGKYGDLPAHNGLWEAAEATSQDLAARLAVAPMVLEARGLDVTPGMISKLQSVDDADSAAVLQTIYDEEIGHVAAGAKWFERICTSEGADPETRFHALVAAHFKGALKRPFNQTARAQAGLEPSYYEPLAAVDGP